MFSISDGETFLPPAVITMSLMPVDDPQVRPVDPLADVAGVQPAVRVDGLGGRLGLAPVPGERAGVAGEDLAGLLRRGAARCRPAARRPFRASRDPAGSSSPRRRSRSSRRSRGSIADARRTTRAPRALSARRPMTANRHGAGRCARATPGTGRGSRACSAAGCERVCSPPFATSSRPIPWPAASRSGSSRRFTREAEAIRTSTLARIFSQMRGTPRNIVGCTSRRFSARSRSTRRSAPGCRTGR